MYEFAWQLGTLRSQLIVEKEPQMTRTNDTGFFASLRFRYGLALIGFLAIAGYFLWEEHEVHILGYLPWILILGACAGMHLFMHGGHGGGHGSHRDDPGEGDR